MEFGVIIVSEVWLHVACPGQLFSPLVGCRRGNRLRPAIGWFSEGVWRIANMPEALRAGRHLISKREEEVNIWQRTPRFAEPRALLADVWAWWRL